MNGKGDKDRTKNVKQYRSNWENLFAKAQKKKDEKSRNERFWHSEFEPNFVKEKELLEETDAED